MTLEHVLWWVQLVALVANLTIAPLVYLVWKIRTNDLEHIDEKLDDLRDSLSRIEDKLDSHLSWHLSSAS